MRISLYYSYLQAVLLFLKLLLTPFCFSYYFKFLRDQNENKALTSLRYSRRLVFAINNLGFISLLSLTIIVN